MELRLRPSQVYAYGKEAARAYIDKCGSVAIAFRPPKYKEIYLNAERPWLDTMLDTRFDQHEGELGPRIICVTKGKAKAEGYKEPKW